MSWILLEDASQIAQIKSDSNLRPQVIFKHSTRCSISVTAKARLDKAGFPDGLDFYYLDLLSYRTLSSQIAEDFSVFHESPQALIIKNGHCVYDESHLGISMNEIVSAAAV
jgi:bacillithiol system protein YtxJ